MKNWHSYLFILLLVFVCTLPNALAGGSLKSFKGWELYSWQAGGQWRFSLLTGTNRQKQCDEIKCEKKALTLAELKRELKNLSAEEPVFWTSRADDCSLAVPPDSIKESIKADCQKLHLQLFLPLEVQSKADSNKTE
ncbi:MAG: hypothetical protein K2W82_10270 [Candidatus Obscuribacterales bacterium]|nr:hypothetical protein [Candidatus Obscuribacterales bacterium]